MDFRKLEAFCRVYEAHSFSKAGELMHLSQPTISAHIAALEEYLGLPLFDRLGRSVLPTHAGDVLYRESGGVFSLLERAEAELALLRNEVAGDLIIGGSTIPANYILPELVARFLAKHAAVRLELRTGDTDQILGLVLDGTLDMAVVGDAPGQRGLIGEPLVSDDLVVVASPEFWLQGEDILQWPWILREQGSGTLRAFERALVRNGLDPSSLCSRCSVYGTEAAVRVAVAGAGVTVVSARACAQELAQGQLRIVPTTLQHMRRQFYLVWHEARRAFPAATAMKRFLREAGVDASVPQPPC